jgi:hypothetical protein
MKWFTALYEEALSGCQQGNSDAIHGSLLMFKEFLLYSGDVSLTHCVIKITSKCVIVFERQVQIGV